MSAFEDFVQTELPLRPYVSSDGSQESIAIRRGLGPRQVQFLDLQDGQFLGRVNGELRGVTLATRQVILDVAIGSPSTTWTINHNFNSYNCTVQVYQNISGGGYEWVIPNSITLSDSNNIVITFNSSISGKAVVTFLD